MVYLRLTYIAQKRLYLSLLLKQIDQLKQHLLTKNSYKCKFIKTKNQNKYSFVYLEGG